MLMLVPVQCGGYVSFLHETKILPRNVRQGLERPKKINRNAPGTGGWVGLGRRPRDLRQILEGIFHILRGGYPWRDLPGRFGPWQTVYGRFRKYCLEGFWAKLFGEAAKGAKGKLRFIDGSYVRVHQDGAPAVGLADSEGVGTSRGGRNSKIHALVDLHGRAVKLIITPGNVHDISAAPDLVEGLKESVVIADKAYDSDSIIEYLNASNIQAVIPPRCNRLVQRAFDKHLYRNRNLVERFFCRIKQFRRIATRYDKLAQRFASFVAFTAAIIWLA